MKKTVALLCSLLLGAAAAFAQDGDKIPTNYDETKTGDYRIGLPDPLTFNNGRKVTTSRQWKKRRAEIFRIFEDNQFGRWPARKPKLRYSVEQDAGFDGMAVRKQVSLFFSGDDGGPRADVLLYLPKDAAGPVPVLLNLSFSANNYVIADPGVKPGRRWDRASGTMVETPSMPGMGAFSMDSTVRKYLEAGYGFATLCYTDITPDYEDHNELGLRGLYHKTGAGRASDDWGSISAWSLGVSRVMDYFKKDPDVDAGRVALTGCSRLGKTTLWAAACEPRIKVVIASCSGEGGAAMSRRNFGETVADLTDPERLLYQFCPRYGYWADKVYEMPMDAHMLIALVAPRPLLLQTASKDDWSDPRGEWISAVEAGKVYELLGCDDLGTSVMPAPETPIFNTLGYVMHEGGHGVMPQDWGYYLEYLERYL